MPNSNSQIDGLGSFNQSAENAGTIKYGAFLNAARNTGSIALSATFGNTSQNLGTIGDVLPITTATILQSNSAKWDSTYTTVMQNSAMWALSGGTSSITETFVGDVITSIINTDNFVLTTDSRLSDIPMGVEAYTTLQSNSASFIKEGDARLTDARTPLTHTHDASAITSGKLDVDRIPVLPSMEVVVIEGIMYDNNAFAGSDENLVVDGFTYQLSSIAKGTVVTTTDGNRFVYKGEGGKRFASSYIQLADITPDWSVISNKPSVFTPDVHTHTMSEISDLASHGHTMSDITDLRNTYWDTSYSYVTANSANIVMTSDVRLSRASTAYSYVTANSANLVMTSDVRLSRASTAFSYVTANSANIVMTSDSRLEEATIAYTSVQTNSATWAVGARGSINYTIDGGGSAIATGSKGFIQVPNNFIIQQWDIIADLQTTSFIVDVRKSSYDNLPTTTSIVGSDFLTLTNQQKNRNLSVSWTNISAGDFVEFYVTDASNASMINISLKGVRS